MYRSTNHTPPRIPLALEQLTSRSNPTTSVYVTTITSSDHGPRKLHTFLQISCPKIQLIHSVQVVQVRAVASKFLRSAPLPNLIQIPNQKLPTAYADHECSMQPQANEIPGSSRFHSSPRIIAACIQHTRVRGADGDHWAGKCASSCTVVVWVERIRAQGYTSGLARQGSSLASDLCANEHTTPMFGY
jgi:hypothetical protein